MKFLPKVMCPVCKEVFRNRSDLTEHKAKNWASRWCCNIYRTRKKRQSRPKHRGKTPLILRSLTDAQYVIKDLKQKSL